jgi:hypothetical protein
MAEQQSSCELCRWWLPHSKAKRPLFGTCTAPVPASARLATDGRGLPDDRYTRRWQGYDCPCFKPKEAGKPTKEIK